jgi:hypothetical protein
VLCWWLLQQYCCTAHAQLQTALLLLHSLLQAHALTLQQLLSFGGLRAAADSLRAMVDREQL